MDSLAETIPPSYVEPASKALSMAIKGSHTSYPEKSAGRQAQAKTPSAGVLACTSPPEIRCLLYIYPRLYVTSNTLRSSRSLSRKKFSHLPAPSQLTSPGPQQA